MLCALLFQLLFFSATRSEVEEWTVENFKSQVAIHDLTLVMFHSPHCGHCKRLAPEFEKAHDIISKKFHEIELSKVDCSSHSQLCQEHDVNGYPTLKIFRNGEYERMYDGERTHESIVSFMTTLLNPSVELKSISEKESAVINELPVVIAYFEAGNKFYSSFVSLASDFIGKVKFYHTHDISILGVSKNERRVELYRPHMLESKFESSKVIYDADLNVKSIQKWIERECYGLVGYRTQQNAMAFETGLKVVLYFNASITDNRAVVRYYRNRMASGYEKAGALGFDLKMAYSPSMDFGHQLRMMFDDTPNFPLVILTDTKGKNYVLQNFNVDNFANFLKEYKAGTLKAFVKSQPIPTSQDGPVAVLVADNFEETVNAGTKDYFIMFHAPYCLHCKALLPTFSEVAEALKDETDVVLATFDATGNDVPSDFTVNGYPTLYFVQKNNLKTPIAYEGSRKKKDMIKFIAANSSNELKGYNRRGVAKKLEL